MKPNTPIHADIRWNIGFWSVDLTLPILCEKEMSKKSMKKVIMKAMATAMKVAVEATGAERR